MNFNEVNWSICDKLSHDLVCKEVKHKVKYDDGYKLLDLESRECLVRFFFGENIGISMNIRTVNFADVYTWIFCSGIADVCGCAVGSSDTRSSIEEYKKVTLKYLLKLVFMWQNTPFAPEWRKEMIPHNYDEIVALIGDTHWSTVYEHLMFFPCTYKNREQLDKWLYLVSDRKFMNEIRKL